MSHHSFYTNVVDMFPPTDSAKNDVDMFPRTDSSKDIHSVLSSHVESIVLMTNSGSKGK